MAGRMTILRNYDKEDREDARERAARDEHRRKARRNITGIAVFFTCLFLGLGGYYAWFIQVRSRTIIGSPYNPRVDLLAERVVRGSILSADGKTLAETKTSSDGTETRYYPFEYLYVHSVGYSGKNGKSGLESLANFDLLNSDTNLLVKTLNEFQNKKNPGDNLVTTLRADLQETANSAMGNNRGAVVAIEPDTGKVLCMLSQPNFNANEVDERWQELIADSDSKAVLLNRASQGLYPPGSTFKILTLLEYIREHPNDWMNFTYTCNGTYKSENGYSIRCYHGEEHGAQTIEQAFANSCNGAFAKIGESLDPDRFRELAESVGFNGSLPYDLVSSRSLFPLTSDSEPWEKAQTAIGQGKTMMTPLLNCMITAAIANSGTMMKPYLEDSIENANGRKVKSFLPSSVGEIMSASEAEALTTFMRDVVTEGTGSAFRNASYTAAGKTGTAETGTDSDSHAWFVGFAPVEDPKIAVCVIVENGESGGKTAAPIARAVVDQYLAK